MVELPYHLKRFEPLPSALDILRFLGTCEEYTADIDEICDGLDISERRFGKAIRRVVTNGYVEMTEEQVYRLTRKGTEAIVELAEYDKHAPSRPVQDVTDSKIARRLIVALPPLLAAGRPANCFVGFHPDPQNRLETPADVVLRISAINGALGSEGDEIIKLDNGQAHRHIALTPGQQTPLRLRVQVFQLDSTGEDITNCGGLYVDVDVTGGEAPADMVAYGTDVYLDPTL